MRFLVIVSALAFWGSFASKPAQAAEIGFELYSWQQGSRWNYAIFEGTMTARSAAALRSPKNRLNDLNHLKGRIATLPAGEKLYWRENKKRGLRLPPKEIIREIDQYAQIAQITLLLPQQTTDAKTLDQLQDETQHIIE
jgi:hypothetical protein